MVSQRRPPQPFFETSPRSGGRNLLLITYSFPPDATVGALRWEMMLRHAAKLGWAADVLLMDPTSSTDCDQSRVATLPVGTRLFGASLPRSIVAALLQWKRWWHSHPSILPHLEDRRGLRLPTDRSPQLMRLMRALKRSILAWDYYSVWGRWARYVSESGTILGNTRRYECIVSSGPPHMAHEAARRTALALSRPLITDFRDPWTSEDVEPPWMAGTVWRMLSHRYEKRAVDGSAIIVANTDAAARLMCAKYPHAAARVITVMNGADGEPFTACPRELPFTISYTGGLYGGRYPDTLFRGVRDAIQRWRLSPSDLVLRFMGVEESQCTALHRLAYREGIAGYFTCEVRRHRADAMALLERSAMLVVLPQIHVHSIPAKVFEYVQRRAWLLVLASPGAAVVELLRGTSADIVSPDDVVALGDIISQHFQEFRAGVRPMPVNVDSRFSREHQASRFFGELERVIR